MKRRSESQRDVMRARERERDIAKLKDRWTHK